MKLVSIIIPCYKDSKTLSRAIESVLKQTYKEIEIIVVNDCSPETELIEKCLSAYPQVRYLCNSVNVGLAATRNNGLAMANGEIVAFLDADDEYHQDKIAKQIEVLKHNMVVTCAVAIVYPDGSISKKNRKDRLVCNERNLLYRNTLNGAGLLASKSLLLKHGGYDPNLRSCEDFDFWLRLLSSNVKVKEIGVPLYLYHYNEAGLSKNIKNISIWELKVIHNYFSRIKHDMLPAMTYSSVVLVWLIRHLLRAEMAGDKELRLQTLSHQTLLDGMPLTKMFFYIIAYSRVMIIPSFLIKLWKNRPNKNDV